VTTAYLEDVIFPLVLVVRRHCALQKAEDEGGVGSILLRLQIRIEEKLVTLETHIELLPVLVLYSVREGEIVRRRSGEK